MGFLKRWEVQFCGWILAFSIGLGVFVFTFKAEREKEQQKCLNNFLLIQKTIYKNVESKQVFLNSLAEKAFKDPTSRLPCNLTIYIFDENRQLIKTTDPQFNQLPSTKNIDDLLLISPLSQTPQWATISGLNRAKPEIFYIYPLKKNEKIENYALFRFMRADLLIEEFLQGTQNDYFSSSMYVYQDGFRNPIEFDRNLKVSSNVIQQALSGENKILESIGLIGTKNYACFYLPDIKFGFVLESFSFYSVLIYIEAFVLFLLLISCLVLPFSESKNSCSITGIMKCYSVFSHMVIFLVILLGCAAGYLGIAYLKEKKDSVEAQKSAFNFAARSAVVKINQYLEEFKGVLETFVTLKYGLNRPNDAILEQLNRYGILAVNFYEKPLNGVYQETLTLNKFNWVPTTLLPNPYTEDFKIEGPINDPVLGSIFIFSTQKNIGNQGSCSIVVEGNTINDILEILTHTYSQPFSITDQEGHFLYQYQTTKNPDLLLSIPAAKWNFISSSTGLKVPYLKQSFLIHFLFFFTLFILSILFWIFTQFDTIFSFRVLPIASLGFLLCVLIFQVFAFNILQYRIKEEQKSVLSNKEEILNQVESIKQAYDLFHEEPLRLVPVNLMVDGFWIKGIDIVNAAGFFSSQLDEKSDLYIYTAIAGVNTLRSNQESPPKYFFNYDYIDDSEFKEFPFNPRQLTLPLQIASNEKILFVPDFENLEELSRLQIQGIDFVKVGCKYIKKEGIEIPILQYEFVFKRGIVHVIACYLLPLLIGLAILYQSFITRKLGDDIKTFIPVWGSVMFIVLLMYVSFRGYLGNRILSFLENVYIGSLVLLIVVQAMSLIQKIGQDERFFLYVRYFYWPVWSIITLFISYFALT